MTRRREDIAVWRRNRRGIAAVEFGIFAPLLLFLAVVMVDFGFAFNNKLRIVSATSTAAQYAFANGQSLNASTLSTFRTNVTTVAQTTANMTSAPTVTVLFNNAADSSTLANFYCASGFAPVTWTSTGTSSVSCGGSVMSGKFVTITVMSTANSLFKSDSILGRVITTTDTAIVRVQ